MKKLILFSMVALTLSGCMQEYPEQPGNGGSNDKNCGILSSRTLTYLYSGALPTKISASVNGIPVVNECTMSSDNSNYLITRQGNSVTIMFRVNNNAALTEKFFFDNGVPRGDVRFMIDLRGRSNCSDTPMSFHTNSLAPNWQASYSQDKDGGRCDSKGYHAELSN